MSRTTSAMESWTPIKNFEGLYEVSTLGQVRGVDRMRMYGTGLSLHKGKILSQWKQGNYMYCDLRKPGIKQKARIHVVVLESFVGERPSGMVACHNNGNSCDNRLCNLRWATHKENAKDKVLHGTHKYGESCGNAKLTENQALAILLSQESYAKTALQFGVSKATVTHIKTGRNWPHLQIQLANV